MHRATRRRGHGPRRELILRPPSVSATSESSAVILLVAFDVIAQAIMIAVITAGFSLGQHELEVP